MPPPLSLFAPLQLGRCILSERITLEDGYAWSADVVPQKRTTAAVRVGGADGTGHTAGGTLLADAGPMATVPAIEASVAQLFRRVAGLVGAVAHSIDAVGVVRAGRIGRAGA